jgi:hypothetical protein
MNTPRLPPPSDQQQARSDLLSTIRLIKSLPDDREIELRLDVALQMLDACEEYLVAEEGARPDSHPASARVLNACAKARAHLRSVDR